jgi:hypothetical protein
MADHAGMESARFGATTSGHAVLFDRAGRKLFDGGITPSRGHQGDSEGLRAIELRLAGIHASARTDVYGCPLFDPAVVDHRGTP